MKATTVAPFMMIGLAIRTTNENGQSATDIPALWQQFFSEQLGGLIPAKTDDCIYCVYTDYEGDHTQPYTTLLGCKVDALNNIPDGLTGRSFEGGDYTLVEANGKMEEGFVFKAWQDIWASDIPRAFTADFEVYTPAALSGAPATVPIFLAVH